MVFYAHDRAFVCELGAIQSILPDPTFGSEHEHALEHRSPHDRTLTSFPRARPEQSGCTDTCPARCVDMPSRQSVRYAIHCGRNDTLGTPEISAGKG
jgi:hypothetical protein